MTSTIDCKQFTQDQYRIKLLNGYKCYISGFTPPNTSEIEIHLSRNVSYFVEHDNHSDFLYWLQLIST